MKLQKSAWVACSSRLQVTTGNLKCRLSVWKGLLITFRQENVFKRKCSVIMVYRSVILPSFHLNWISRALNSSQYFWKTSLRQANVWYSHGLELVVGRILASSLLWSPCLQLQQRTGPDSCICINHCHLKMQTSAVRRSSEASDSQFSLKKRIKRWIKPGN